MVHLEEEFSNPLDFSRVFVDTALLATYYGATCVYIVLIANSVSKVINPYLEGEGWHVRIYILIVLIPVILIGQIRELKYLVPFSALANLFIVITLGITLYYIFHGPITLADKPNVASWSQMVRITYLSIAFQ